MPRLIILAQNIGAFPAKFLLRGYRETNGIMHPTPVFTFEAAKETPPGEFYSYDANVESTEPIHELHFRSPPPSEGGFGKFHIDTLKWGEHYMVKPIIMHNPIGMKREL